MAVVRVSARFLLSSATAKPVDQGSIDPERLSCGDDINLIASNPNKVRHAVLLWPYGCEGQIWAPREIYHSIKATSPALKQLACDPPRSRAPCDRLFLVRSTPFKEDAATCFSHVFSMTDREIRPSWSRLADEQCYGAQGSLLLKALGGRAFSDSGSLSLESLLTGLSKEFCLIYMPLPLYRVREEAPKLFM